MNVHNPTPVPTVTDQQLHDMAPKLFLERRLKEVDRTWSVVMGKRMNNALVHSFHTQQVFIKLAYLEGFPRADIGEGCYMLVNHDRPEILTSDRNTYNRDLVQCNEQEAIQRMDGGQFYYPMVEEVLHDYENGKKGLGSDPRLVRIAKLCKDADKFETVLEQMEDAAIYNSMRFNSEAVQQEIRHKRDSYFYESTKRVHTAVIKYGLMAVHDAFLLLPNTIKKGTY